LESASPGHGSSSMATRKSRTVAGRRSIAVPC
jgi:hypothetical protein